MPEHKAASPWRFLTALDGSRDIDRQIIQKTRAEDLDLVNHMIMAARASILYAGSGTGKTSLLNAGVIPHFVDLGFAVFRTRPRPPWAVDDPVAAFEECMIREQWLPQAAGHLLKFFDSARTELQKLDPPPSSSTQVILSQLEAQADRLSQTPEARSADLAAFLKRRKGGGSLAKTLSAVQSFLGPDTGILLICDQFEELFVHYSGTSQLHEFVQQIGDICKSRNNRAKLLFSMREDWVGSMIEFRPVIPDVFNYYYKLAPITTENAVAALQLPLSGVGETMDLPVVHRILADLAACFPSPESQAQPRTTAYIELPALQIVAEALWNTRGSFQPPFTELHYESLGKSHAQSRNGAAAS